MAYLSEQLLILANTYPNPSSKYRETNCVAALNSSGRMRRLFPIPYRLLDGRGQFKKWEWIQANIQKAANDHRPESYRIDVDSIERQGQIDTKAMWHERLRRLGPNIVDGFDELEHRRKTTGETLGAIGPVDLLRLELVPEQSPDWTSEELTNLTQSGLFDSPQVKNRAQLRKLPFRFYYRYRFGGNEHRHLITDWEAGTLYWRCVREYGNQWEEYFRKRLEDDFSNKDLLLLMGTVHRFPDQWLIVSLIYPPKGALENPSQLSMFG